MKKLFIADIRGNVVNGRVSGHIVPVAKNYKEVLCHDYDIVIAAGPAILNSFDKKECLILPYNVSSDKLVDKFHVFANFIYLLWKAKGCPIIIQQSTIVTTFLAVLFFYWWTSPLYVIQYNTDALNSRVKRFINKITQYKLTGILCPSDRIGQAYGGRYCVVPDYFFTKKHVNVLLYEDRKWDIGIIGGITENKGTIEAARYLAKTKFKVLIAGRICEEGLDKPLKEIVASCGNIDLRIGFLSDEEYNLFIRESRFCMLNYRGTYFDRSSGVVLDAIYNGTPVIGTRCEALKVIEGNNLGILYDNIEEINLDENLMPNKYNSCLYNIKEFLDCQAQYKDKLISFLK